MTSKGMTGSEHLESSHDGLCNDWFCDQIVKMRADGRWFITMMHCGFNNSANNRAGYSTMGRALNASRKLLKARSTGLPCGPAILGKIGGCKDEIGILCEYCATQEAR